MAAKRAPLKKVLEEFRNRAGKLHRSSPRRLLEAIRLVALEDQDDSEPPNQLPLDKVVDVAARLAARVDPNRPPLDQVVNRRLLWELFQELGALGLGRCWKGRRGARTRFGFKSDLVCKQLRGVLDELEVRQRSLDGAGQPQLPSALPISPETPARAAGEALDRDRVVALLRDHGDELRQLGVTQLSLFGSVARNDARPDSDVDLLASFERPVTSDTFFAAKFFLEDLLGRRVDLLTESALRERVRASMEPELIRVA
jgi:uncharacterized protein